MKINWNASDRVKQVAIKASELKEKGYTYKPLQDLLGYSREYTIALKMYGDKLRKEQND